MPAKTWIDPAPDYSRVRCSIEGQSISLSIMKDMHPGHRGSAERIDFPPYVWDWIKQQLSR